MATHLKSLAKKAKLDEGHAKEVVKLKSDLKHTTSARARSEGIEDEARNSLRAAEGELREVRDELRTAKNDLLEARDEL